MTPKRWINHIRWIEGRNKAICDGLSEDVGMVSIFYPLFVFSGISIFLLIVIKWDWIINKIKNG